MVERLQECQSTLLFLAPKFSLFTPDLPPSPWPIFHQLTTDDILIDAASLPPHLKLYLPEPAPTPAPTSAAIMDEPPPSPTPIPASLREMPIAPNYAGSRQKLSASSRASENWEVLSESGASLVSPPKGKSGSISSWKSACNGECLNEFGGGE